MCSPAVIIVIILPMHLTFYDREKHHFIQCTSVKFSEGQAFLAEPLEFCFEVAVHNALHFQPGVSCVIENKLLLHIILNGAN